MKTKSRRFVDIKRYIAGLAVGVFCFMALSGCGKEEEQDDEKVIVIQHPEERVSYSFVTAAFSDVSKTAKMRCTYKQVTGADVSFTLGGKKIETVYVKEGDTVKKGQLLCELSVQDLEKQIEALEYQIARNELLMGYMEEEENVAISGYWVDYLYNSRMTESDLDRLHARVENVQQSYRYKKEDYSDTLELQRAQLAELKAELSASRVYARTAGVIYKLKTNLEGTLSDEDMVIMTIMDTTECLFETKSVEYAEYFKEGDIIPMTIKNGASQGEYELTPWHMEEWGDVLTFKVVNLTDGAVITVGTSGNVEMTVEKRENVLAVPSSTIKKADGKTYVYVLGKDNIREVRWVETGFYGDNTVEITGGLSEGEKVILK